MHAHLQLINFRYDSVQDGHHDQLSLEKAKNDSNSVSFTNSAVKVSVAKSH